MRLLLTRPLRDSQRSAARLRALGHEVLVAPVLNIVPTRETCPEQPADAVLATSSHAFDHADRLPAALRSLPLHVVGERTGHAAVTAGFRTPETVAPDAETLVRGLSTTIASCTQYLYLAGRDRSPRLETALIAAGNTIIPWEIYEAAPIKTLDTAALDALAAGRIDAVLHFSPRSAAIFVDLATKAGRLPQAMAALQVAISQRAAEPLRAHASRVRVAATPDLDGMIATLV